MNGLPYYKAYPRDFIEGTIGMSFELKGAYRLVLDLIYMQGGELPDDARYISGLLGCSVRKWKSLRSELVALGKLHVIGSCLSNYRAEKELETLVKLQETKRENRAGFSKNNNLEKRPSDDTEPDTDTDKKEVPKGTPKKPASGSVNDAPKPVDILAEASTPEAARSFVAYRQKQRKALTVTAAERLARVLSEISENGGDPSDALGMAEERGWQAVKADWYFREAKAGGKAIAGGDWRNWL